MANRKVRLMRLCKTEHGWKRYPAVVGKKGRVKPDYALVQGAEVHFPDGRYQLRVYDSSRMVYINAGSSAADAQAARDRHTHLLSARISAKAAGIEIQAKPTQETLVRLLDKFVEAAEDRGSSVAAKHYLYNGNEFVSILGRTYPDEITKEDMLAYQRTIRKNGATPRTIYNKHISVLSFLKYCGLDTKKLAPAKPRYEKTVPEVYTQSELSTFFASIKRPHLYLICDLLLKTGLRRLEAVYLTWDKIDFHSGILKVRSNPTYKFKIKDKEERDVPVPSDLLARLKQYHEEYPDRVLVTGTKFDTPNLRLLRILKRQAKRAGLNCNRCPSCKQFNECEHWFLHKFRATCITTLLQSGLDLRTVMSFSGHSGLQAVMRYLSPAQNEAVKTHINAMKWM